MHAYDPIPCPHCGATWNGPDARFCQACHKPLVDKPRSKASGKPILVALGAFLIVAAIAILVVMPILASNELAADRQALAATVSRRTTVDEAIGTFLTPLNKQTGHGGINETDLQLSTIRRPAPFCLSSEPTATARQLNR